MPVSCNRPDPFHRARKPRDRANVSADIQPEVNANLQTYTNGTNYPLGGSTLTYAGVPFTLAYYDATNQTGTGVIQTPGGVSSFDVKVDVVSPVAVYTLINSAYGQFATPSDRSSSRRQAALTTR